MGDTEEPGGGGDTVKGNTNSQSIVENDVLGERVIKDGLLCSILCALSRSPNIDELISCIERDTPDVSEILEARRKLFTYYSWVMYTTRKKLILDIDRHSTKN